MICFSPVIPHFASECLEEIGETDNVLWPNFDTTLLESEDVNYVIQFNGKKRAILKAKKDIHEQDLLEIVKKDKIVNKYFGEKEIIKIIFVKNRLINILVNE